MRAWEAKVFDVVVVGGGAAGCVVAARLAEPASRSVLLLEAGPDRRADLPPELRDGWSISREFDWGYVSEPDPRGQVENVRRNKLLGGTSWVTRFALRGSPADYDAWVALGGAGWSFEDVLPYFVRLEADAEFGDRPWHGAGGPLPCTRYPRLDFTEVGVASLAAFEAVGFATVDDHNRPGAVGAGRMPMSSRDGRRVTTADAYLAVGTISANLTVGADAEVAEVLLDGARARGVRLVDGSEIEAGAVVLCAGTYGSPAILLRSGIGPAEQLGSLGIPVRVDLCGVGANLADHPAIDIDLAYRGPGRSSPLLHSIATFHSAQSSAADPPDLMLWISDPTGEPATVECTVVLLKPRSRGSIRLRSPDPTQPPIIELPSLGDPADIDRLIDGYHRGLEVANQPGLRRACDDPMPAVPRNADHLRALIRSERYSLPHVVGTCAMGLRAEDGGVVDASGGVHGVEGLTVADASIMPDAPSGFTYIPTVMIAERLSEQIALQL